MLLQRLRPFSPFKISLTTSLISAYNLREAGKRKTQGTLDSENRIDQQTHFENLLIQTLHFFRKRRLAGLTFGEHSVSELFFTNREASFKLKAMLNYRLD